MGSGSPRPAAWFWSRWTFKSRVLHDARLKGGLSTTHLLQGNEVRAAKLPVAVHPNFYAMAAALLLPTRAQTPD